MGSRLLALLRQQPVALLALFVALGGTSFAAARGGGRAEGNVIHGCVGDNTGRLRIVDSPIRCGSLEAPIAFDREGRRGPGGPAGRRGPRGETGNAGAVGPQGAKGDAGATGAAGFNGDAGAKGDAGATGAQGDAGATGAKGDAGATGSRGDDGLNAVTATAAEAAGPNCASGGIVFTGGQDANRNGTLDAAEVNPALTRYVCNGAPETAAQTLARIETVDGSGSGLDADRLDGHDASSFVTAGAFDSAFDTSLRRHFFSGTPTMMSNASGGNNDYMAQIYLTAANFPPPGTAIAAGQILPISQNTALFSLLGTTYGGDGVTTFALPDLRDEAPAGTNYVIALVGIYPSRN